MWGKLIRRASPVGPNRNIPTRVGKTSAGPGARCVCPEHPHACGENDPGGRAHRRKGRNIPTRVGKTSSGMAYFDLLAEHPHACGENTRLNLCLTFCLGTSPRVWGKLRVLAGSQYNRRNIPTRVGKTPARSHRWRKFPEHPHACGENR